MKLTLTATAAFASLLFAGQAFAAGLTVSTEGGTLQGFTKTVPGTSSAVEGFLGVPFAAPPVGENRWKTAQPVKAWKGVRMADVAPNACKQRGTGSEDCLYVNIYRPAGMRAGRKLPVAVYGHGGANISGNATMHDGSRMASENNVIVVTLQHRLGAFGFLSLLRHSYLCSAIRTESGIIREHFSAFVAKHSGPPLYYGRYSLSIIVAKFM